MTNEEAKEMIKSASVLLGRGNGKTAYVMALDMAVSALEKQVPKKPTISSPILCIEGKDLTLRIPKCPECEAVVNRFQQYCGYCGQRILWEDDNG